MVFFCCNKKVVQEDTKLDLNNVVNNKVADETVRTKTTRPNYLLTVKPQDLPKFPKEWEYKYGIVYDAYDGDTLSIVFDHRDAPIKYSLRIEGIDTPELRSKHGHVRQRAEAAKEFVHKLLKLGEHATGDENELHLFHLKGYDKYGGRVVGDVEVQVEGKRYLLSKLLLDNKYAVPYNAGRKMEEIQFLQFVCTNPIPSPIVLEK